MELIITLAVLLTSLAGIVTSAILLWRRVIRPFFRFCKRLGKVVDVVQDLPEWCATVDYTLNALHNESAALKNQVCATNDLLERHIKDPSLHRSD